MADLIVVSSGLSRFQGHDIRCAIGKGGFIENKHEGDGGTPVGIWPMRRILYRPDRLTTPPASGLPVSTINPTDGWCDDPSHRDYNRPVRLPFAASHETLWRDDGLYDVIVVLGHNDDPPIPGRGSAVFFHCAAPDYRPTEGCVAIARTDILTVLSGCDTASSVVVQPAGG